MIGHLAVLGTVRLVVGVHEIQVGTAYFHLPQAGGDWSSRESHAGGHPVSIFVHDRGRGDLHEVLRIVVRDLVALAGNHLGEIAVAIQEAHGDQVHVHVGSLLQVVAGQDAETAGIDLQGGVQAVFHAEIGDGRIRPLGLRRHVGVEFGQDGVHLPEEEFILGKLLETLDTHGIQDGQRIVAGGMPDLGVDGPEQILCALVPAPPEVLGKPLQRGKFGGQVARHQDGPPARAVKF